MPYRHSPLFSFAALVVIGLGWLKTVRGFALPSIRLHSGTPFQTSRTSSSPSLVSSRTRLYVATSPPLPNMMPELGKDGVYHVQNEAEHRALLEAHQDQLVVLKVFAPWCRACKGLEPKFNAIVKDPKYANLPIVWADLTIQHNKDFVKSIGVLALPSIQFYAHGLTQDTFPCGPSKVPILKRKLAQFVNQNVDAATLTVKPLAANATTMTDAPVVVNSTTVAAATTTTTDSAKGAALQSNWPSRDLVVDNTTATQQQQQQQQQAPTFTTPLEEFVQQHKSNLREIPYFSTLPELEFETMLSKAQLLTFDAGSIIMKEGNKGRTFYYLVQGEVEICQHTSLEDPLTTPPSYLGTVINSLEAGEYFGERALLTGEPRAASIRAASRPTRCLALDQDDIPPSCVLSPVGGRMSADPQVEAVNEKYGVSFLESSGGMTDAQYSEFLKANQVRGSPNRPNPIDGVDNDNVVLEEEDEELILMPGETTTGGDASSLSSTLGVRAETIVPLLMRFQLVRLITRCFDYIMKHPITLGDVAVQRRRNHLVNLLTAAQKAEIQDAWRLIDMDGDGEITLMELRRLMESVGDNKSDEELMEVIFETSMHPARSSRSRMDGKQVITHHEFMGVMAEAEFYHLFLETFRTLDERDSGYVRAKDLDRILCGVRDLITDDRRSIIDVEDKEMMVDYEQFTRMLLGSALI